MPMSVNDAGTWRTLTDVHVNDAGTWRRIQEVWVNDAGTWRMVHVGDVVAITSQTITDSQLDPTPAVVSYQLQSDGNVEATSGGFPSALGDWVTPTASAGAAYEARATIVSGSLTSGTAGSWLPLSSNRTWSLTRSVIGFSTTVLTIEIRRAADGVVLTTATITLEANVT